jgi:DNA-binding response OmpR family regulator
MINEYPNFFKFSYKEHSRSPIIKRALVVYGQSEVGIKIGTVLEQFCFSVDVVHNGLEAMKLIHLCCPYDILITELLLDEISGFALVTVAKKFPDVATIGINNGNVSLKKIADEYGIDGILEPPFDLKELCQLSLKILGITTNTQIMES